MSRKIRPVHIVIMAVSLTIISAMPIASATIKVGVLAPRGGLKAIKRWNEFSHYINKAVGESVRFEPFHPKTFDKVAISEKFDFMLTNPAQAVILSKVYKAKPLASMEKKSGNQFAGVIISKKGSGIKVASDLKGKRVTSLKENAAGGYVFQAHHLLTKGINPKTDFSALIVGQKQDSLVMAVKSGVVDAAFIRSGILEFMVKEGRIKLEEFNVVDQRFDKELQLVHTTKLYPEWYMLAMSKTDDKLAEKIKAAFINMPRNSAAAVSAKIVGFVEPLPLRTMEDAMQTLHVGPFK